MHAWEIAPADQLRRELIQFSQRIDAASLEDADYRAALAKVDRALENTIRYMSDRKSGQPRDADREHLLTSDWMAASTALGPVDPQMSQACMLKGLGWTDPAYWAEAESQGYRVGIQDMQEARRALNQRRATAPAQSLPHWFPVVGAAFAAVTILFLMYLIAGPPLENDKRVIFNAFLAFSVAASGAFLGGTAAAQGHITAFKNAPISFSAVGGVAIFIVVFLILQATNWI